MQCAKIRASVTDDSKLNIKLVSTQRIKEYKRRRDVASDGASLWTSVGLIAAFVLAFVGRR